MTDSVEPLSPLRVEPARAGASLAQIRRDERDQRRREREQSPDRGDLDETTGEEDDGRVHVDVRA
jgi:hypothetical protein